MKVLSYALLASCVVVVCGVVARLFSDDDGINIRSSSNKRRRLQVPLDKANISPTACKDGTPCGICQGDCNTDDHCEGDLVCYNKGAATISNDFGYVPGCDGLSSSTTDWCVDPDALAEYLSSKVRSWFV